MSKRTITHGPHSTKPNAGATVYSPVSKEGTEHSRGARWLGGALLIGMGIVAWGLQSAVRHGNESAKEAAMIGLSQTSHNTTATLSAHRATEGRDRTARTPPSGLASLQRHAADEDSRSAPRPGNDESKPSETANDATDRQRLVGSWQTYRSGKRVLTVRDDGTATMVVEPEGVWTYLFGTRLTFELEWKIESGDLIYRAIGGVPADKIKLVTEMWGHQRRQTIRKLTDDRLILIDEDGDPDHDWKRVESEKTDDG